MLARPARLANYCPLVRNRLRISIASAVVRRLEAERPCLKLAPTCRSRRSLRLVLHQGADWSCWCHTRSWTSLFCEIRGLDEAVRDQDVVYAAIADRHDLCDRDAPVRDDQLFALAHSVEELAEVASQLTYADLGDAGSFVAT
jgi:hypothetical protein